MPKCCKYVYPNGQCSSCGTQTNNGLTKGEMTMVHVKKHLSLLGLKVEDKITGFKGVVATISFDLYGCIQAVVNPGTDKDGKLAESCWFDVARLTILDKKPVMALPDFEFGPQAEGKQGAAEKPMFFKS